MNDIYFADHIYIIILFRGGNYNMTSKLNGHPPSCELFDFGLKSTTIHNNSNKRKSTLNKASHSQIALSSPPSCELSIEQLTGQKKD